MCDIVCNIAHTVLCPMRLPRKGGMGIFSRFADGAPKTAFFQSEMVRLECEI